MSPSHRLPRPRPSPRTAAAALFPVAGPLAPARSAFSPGRALLPSIGCALALAAIAPDVGAEGATSYAFGWSRLEGAEGCIGARELAARVEAQLERRPFVAASRAERGIEGRIGPRPDGGFRAVLQLSDARGVVLGTRELTSDTSDCHALDEGLTLSVALLIEPDATSTWATKPGAAAPPDAPSAEATEGEGRPAGASPASGAPAAGPAERAAGKGPARARAAPKPSPFEITALAGFGFGSGLVPTELSDSDQAYDYFSGRPTFEQRSSGLGLGVSLRAGQTFRSGVWVGGSFTYYSGGSVRRDYAAPEGHDGQYEGLVAGSFRAYAPGLELGYVLPVGPLEARPYLGAGLLAYSIDWSTYIGRSGPLPSPGEAALGVAAWPGVALGLPLGPFSVGLDVRYTFVAEAGARGGPSAFGGFGLRL